MQWEKTTADTLHISRDFLNYTHGLDNDAQDGTDFGEDSYFGVLVIKVDF